MESDGLLLNFTTSSSTNLSDKQLATLQGKKAKGSWRERREQRKSVPLPAFHSPKQEEQLKSHSRKNGTAKNATRESRNTIGGVAKLKDPKDGIISSLFTYNPHISKVLPYDNDTDRAGGEITNAPLVSSTFDVPPAMLSFLIDKMQLNAPTQIQSVALPAISRAQQLTQDIVMVAQTGSGKTLAYLLPLFNLLMTMPDRIDRTSGVFALILAPTRELASQIYSVCEQLCRVCHYIVPGLVIGGEKKKSEKARLRKGVNILVGTPGRLADHVDNTARLDFRHVKYVVLDEGDRLIDLGFEETLTRILSSLPSVRTTVLCSATMNAQVNRLKTLALSNQITWVRSEEGSEQKENTPGQLIQRIVTVPAKLRLVALVSRIKDISRRGKRAIVFFSCTDSVDFHFHVFDKSQITPATFRLHGGMNQQQRQQTMSQFNSCQTGGVLLTTDVASRGLDVVVDEVIEYDPPFTIEDHLHRVGRTARAGRKGEAIIFVLPSEQKFESKLREVHPSGVKVESYQSVIQRGFGFSTWQDEATKWQLEIEKDIIRDVDGLKDLAKKAFTAHVRAYTTHSHTSREIFNFRDLHLGHLAKAFALRETPKAINGDSKSSQKQPERKTPRQQMLDAAQRQLDMGEYNIL